MSKIDKETAKQEYDNWCKSWHIGRKRKFMKGEDLDQAEIQEEMIIDMIMEGILVFENDAMVYTPIEAVTQLPVITIKRPRGDILSAGDRFGENQTGKRAIAILSAMTGEAEKLMNMLDVIDLQNCMAVMSHFLMA